MKSKLRATGNQFPPEIIVRSGKPSAVIIPLHEYRDMLTRLEDAEDLKTLKRLRRKSLRFGPLDAFLKESAAPV